MLCDADRGRLVERRGVGKLPVVAEHDSCTAFQPVFNDSSLAHLGLAGGKRYPDGFHSVVLCGMNHKPAPTTAEIDESLARLEPQLPANVVELPLLGDIEVLVWVREVCARV